MARDVVGTASDRLSVVPAQSTDQLVSVVADSVAVAPETARATDAVSAPVGAVELSELPPSGRNGRWLTTGIVIALLLAGVAWAALSHQGPFATAVTLHGSATTQGLALIPGVPHTMAVAIPNTSGVDVQLEEIVTETPTVRAGTAAPECAGRLQVRTSAGRVELARGASALISVTMTLPASAKSCAGAVFDLPVRAVAHQE